MCLTATDLYLYNNVINNKGTTQLDYVIVDGGRLCIHSASGSLRVNHTIVQNTSNKGIVVAGGTATIKNTTTQDTGTTGLFVYSNAQTVAIDNVTVKNINSDKNAHGVNIEAGVVTVTSTESGSVGLKVDTVTGHGIVVKGPAQLNASKIKVAGIPTTRIGIYAYDNGSKSASINIDVADLTGVGTQTDKQGNSSINITTKID